MVFMNTTIESLHDDIMDIKKDMSFIKSVLTEDFELSEHAKAELELARKTPESEYIDLE